MDIRREMTLSLKRNSHQIEGFSGAATFLQKPTKAATREIIQRNHRISLRFAYNQQRVRNNYI